MADREMTVEEKLSQLMELVGPNAQPQSHELSRLAREIPTLCLNIKFFGYYLARQLAAALPPRHDVRPRYVGLQSKASTQTDLESDWVAYWAQQLHVSVIFHRKLWELCYVLQAVYEHGKLGPGMRALGFGCGTEPLPSYFASHGVEVLVTDLAPDDVRVAGWSQTNEHTTALDSAFFPHLVERAQFDRLVGLRYVDMNKIPSDLQDFDVCWSVCALEHLGSIQNGIDFIVNAMSVLKPGGIAIHTTEYNFTQDEVTTDNWNTVLFLRKHFTVIKQRLEALGHTVQPLDFSVGAKPMDRFIDIPPFHHNFCPFLQKEWNDEAPHIKVSADGFPSTCFGFVITKGG